MMPRPSPRAFTLIELLVALAIIVVLIGLLLPAIQKAREAGSRIQCQNNMKHIGIALNDYHSHNGSFPVAALGQPSDPTFRSWIGLCLPYLEQESVFNGGSPGAFDPIYLNTFDPNYIMITATPIKTLLCPSCPLGQVTKGLRDADDTSGGDADALPGGVTNYLAVEGSDTHALGGLSTTGLDGIIVSRYSPGDPYYSFGKPTKITEIIDGTSETIMVGERPPSPDLVYGTWNGNALFGTTQFDCTLGAFNTQVIYNCSNGIDQLSQSRSVFYSPGKSVDVNLITCNSGNYKCNSRLPAYFSPGRPNDFCDTHHFWSFHTGGANWLYADGSVRFMSYAGGPLTKNLATRAGGEIVDNHW